MKALMLFSQEQMYTDFYERPEAVKEILNGLENYHLSLAQNLITELGAEADTRTFQHGHMIKGNILIRDDALAMIPGDIYREFGAVPLVFVNAAPRLKPSLLEVKPLQRFCYSDCSSDGTRTLLYLQVNHRPLRRRL